MDDKEKSSIEEMKRQLYSRGEKGVGVTERRELHEYAGDTTIEDEWAPPRKEPMKKNTRKPKALTIILIISTLFFVGSAGIASYLFFGGSNSVSPENIDIEIQGPATISGGDELTLAIVITNRNNTSLESADLLIEYPDGTRSADNLSEDLLRTRESLGTVAAGERIQKTARAILFGEEGGEAEIKVIFEYRVEGSNAIFFTEQVYPITLSSAPVIVAVDGVNEITSGQSIVFVVVVASNSDTALEDLLLSAEYPFGFEFESSDPRPSFGNSVWKLGELDPEEEHVVTIRGTIVGEDEEERVFRFASGIQSSLDERKLAATFMSVLESVIIKKPFIGVTLVLDGSGDSPFTTTREGNIRADISWFNNLTTKVFDAEIEVSIEGDIVDELTVVAQDGFYRSLDNTVFWNRETNGELAELEPGSSGTVTFSFSPIGLSSGTSFRDPDIHLDISIKGKRLSDRDVPEVIKSSITRTIKIETDLLLTSRAVYFTGPLANSGPLPPQAETETTYTILWTATNSTNAVSDVAVVAALPSYMRFTGITSSASEKIDFNESGGLVTWSIGSMAPNSRRDIAFQVALSPSLSQIGLTPDILKRQTIRGIDVFTRSPVDHLRPSLTTRLTTDPQFKDELGRVVE